MGSLAANPAPDYDGDPTGLTRHAAGTAPRDASIDREPP